MARSRRNRYEGSRILTFGRHPLPPYILGLRLRLLGRTEPEGLASSMRCMLCRGVSTLASQLVARRRSTCSLCCLALYREGRSTRVTARRYCALAGSTAWWVRACPRHCESGVWLGSKRRGRTLNRWCQPISPSASTASNSGLCERSESVPRGYWTGGVNGLRRYPTDGWAS